VKKSIVFIIAALLLGGAVTAAPLGAQETGDRQPATERPGFYNTSVGIMLGTFISPDKNFESIYGSQTSFQFGLNVTRTLLCYQGFQLDASLEFRTFSKSGQAIQDADMPVVTAKFSMTPITLAARVLYPTKYVIPFIGFGEDWTSYKETSSLQNTTGSTSGSHFQIGAYIVVPGFEHLRVKVYYKFSKMTASANGFDIGLGGNEYGLGLSYAFDLFKKAVLSF
jgi:hypothetical protein